MDKIIERVDIFFKLAAGNLLAPKEITDINDDLYGQRGWSAAQHILSRHNLKVAKEGNCYYLERDGARISNVVLKNNDYSFRVEAPGKQARPKPPRSNRVTGTRASVYDKLEKEREGKE